MPKKTYLTPELKNYYLLDFEQVLLLNDPFWGIPEDFLRSVLSEINASENIQTLYSKIKHEKDADDDESYLVLTYTEEIESSLKKVLETFASSFPSGVITVDHMPPSQNLNEGPKTFHIGAIHNKDYFNLHHFRITFISKSYAIHEVLWLQLKEMLVNF